MKHKRKTQITKVKKKPNIKVGRNNHKQRQEKQDENN